MRTLTAPNVDQPKIVAEFFSVASWLLFLLAVMAGVLNVYLVQEVLLSEEVFHNTLGERMAYERIEKMMTEQRAWSWLGYAILPLAVLLQTLVISISLITGVVFSYAKVGFKALFGMVLRVVAIISVLRLLPTVVLIFQDIQVLDDLLRSDWYSLLGLLGRDNVSAFLHVPLAALNLFHLFFVLGLFMGMRYLADKGTTQLALVSYSCGTLLWWLALMYVQVSIG
ncbi:hypothetical protein QWY85_09865 [Neolewinella lacunae]|uniref:Yip1 domain-containing protein n=1 Tax=Neolewinella lacunae TaxID=1517758 RepID=A0A923T7V6_9BACT|nr:hypothetical protein [Neolewinella lacunae]MBC6993954.1 hypothetical protein [Neolewinella lacunae]MDN3634965.1 hypothetical protein [Neolewinella lacunae]